MLIFEAKPGGGIHGDGIFDFGKILLKKVLKSNFAKKANEAINSKVGKSAIKAIQKVAESDTGRALKEKAVSEVKRRVYESLPTKVKHAVDSDIGQEILTEVGNTAFKKLGISKSRKRKKVTTPRKGKKKKTGGNLVYPQHLISQFGSGLLLE